jgi:toxin ParE1/3/4
MPSILIRPLARQDLDDHFLYLADHADIDVADRFLANVDAAFVRLVGHPSIGSPLKLRHPELKGLRKWRLNDFDNFLIFYLPRPKGISVVRVLHSASDWWSLLGLHT